MAVGASPHQSQWITWYNSAGQLNSVAIPGGRHLSLQRGDLCFRADLQALPLDNFDRKNYGKFPRQNITRKLSVFVLSSIPRYRNSGEPLAATEPIFDNRPYTELL